MAQSSWPSPASSRTVTDLQYEHLVAPQYMDGVIGSPTDAPVITADGGGLHVNIATGRYADLRGHGWTSGSSPATLNIGSNSSGSTRTDLVVLGLDRSTWTVTAYVKAGTPGAGAPALQTDAGDTGIYEMPLAEVTVLSGATAISGPQVTTRHWWARPDGVASTGPATRPPAPWPGMRLWEAGSTYVWNGTIWEVTSGLPTPVQSTQGADMSGTSGPTGMTADSTWRDFAGTVFAPLVFVVPQSGRVYITVSGWVESRFDDNSILWLSYRASGGGITGGTASTVMNARGISTRNGRLVASKRQLVTGLTPGATVTLTPTYFGAGTVSSDINITSIRNGNLLMEPSP